MTITHISIRSSRLYRHAAADAGATAQYERRAIDTFLSPHAILSRRKSLLAVGVTCALLTVPLPAVAADNGELAFNNHCRTCHSTKEGDHRLGPSLHKIYGAKAGATSGYGNFSQSLVSSGITWDETTLDKFIANPDEVVSNNNMKPYKGISDVAVRKAIIAFLKSESGG